MSFIEGIKEQARKDKKTIALPESEDERTIRAAAKVLEEGTADLILVGSEEEAKKMASDLGVNIDGAKFVDPATSEDLDSFVETLYELRKHKGMTPEKARDHIRLHAREDRCRRRPRLWCLPLHSQHASPGPANSPHRPRRKARLRFLRHGRSEL